MRRMANLERQGVSFAVETTLSSRGYVPPYSRPDLLRGGTGKTKLVDNLSQMWAEAEAMSGCECDPLDESLIARLTRDVRG